MPWRDLGEPAPRETPEVYSAAGWPHGSVLKLPIPEADQTPFAELSDRRRTHRKFRSVKRETLLALLGATLWSSARVQHSLSTPGDPPLSLRPSPSAGAIHPVNVVVNLPNENTAYRYDPIRHALTDIAAAEAMLAVRRTAEKIYKAEEAALLLFVAEPGLTAAKYENCDSLVWRDAGALQGIMSLAATACGAGLSLLGVTGDQAARDLVRAHELRGVGAAYFGAPAHDELVA